MSGSGRHAVDGMSEAPVKVPFQALDVFISQVSADEQGPGVGDFSAGTKPSGNVAGCMCGEVEDIALRLG